MILNKKEINSYRFPVFPNMNKEPGQEHYKLLANLSRKLCSDNKFNFYDVGTFKGYSALALLYGDPTIQATVKSYDIEDQLDPEVESITTRIDFMIGNVLDDPDLLKADLIVLDTNHDGAFENEFYEFIRRDFKGWLILDDIHLNDQMERFWKSITQKKFDLTAVGHYTGTGLVIF